MKLNAYTFRHSVVLPALIVLFLQYSPLCGQITFDNSFGSNGLFMYNESGTNEEFVSVLELPDGKTIGVATTNFDPDEANNSRIVVVRLNPNGSYDSAWGANGKVYIDTPNSTDVALAATLQADGKILIAGYQGSYTGTLYRLTAAGVLDNTFGTGGKAIIPNESTYQFRNVRVQPNGKIVVSGQGFIESRFAYLIARFNSNGQSDNTFNLTGYNKFRTSTSNTEEDNGAGWGLAIQPDGKIVSCGHNEKNNGIVVRLTVTGALDAGMGANGIRIIDFERKMYLYAVEIQSDEKILIGGTYDYNSSTDKAMIMRFFPQGNFDSSFAGFGFDWYGDEFGIGYDMRLQCDGKILIGGGSSLTRVKTDGTVDASFGNNGYLAFNFNYTPAAQTIYVGATKIYLAGSYYPQSGSIDLGGFILRLNNDIDNISCGAVPTAEADPVPDLKIYPNPVGHLLSVETGMETPVLDILLIDPLGRTVLSSNQFSQDGSTRRGDLSMLPTGMYYLVVRTTQGQRSLPVMKL